MRVDIPSMFLPRGIRNNNPGNIRLTSKKWFGQKNQQTDRDFVEYETPLHGLRALMKVLLAYYFKHGLKDIQSIINRWAPPHENATDAYIYQVCRRLSKKRNDSLDLCDPALLVSLSKAIVLHENGPSKEGLPRDWYLDDYYQLAAQISYRGTPCHLTKRK